MDRLACGKTPENEPAEEGLRTLKLTAVVWQEAGDETYSALCPEIDVYSYGDTPEHAQEMLKEAIELQLRDLPQVTYRSSSVIEVAA